MADSENISGQNLEDTGDLRIAEFINHVHSEAKIKGTDEEIEEQRKYISDIVQSILDTAKDIDPFMAVDEKCECGSFHDGTKILEADEFDYIGKLACSNKLKIEEGCKEGYCHVRPIDPSLAHHIKNTIVKGVEKLINKEYKVTDPSKVELLNADVMRTYFYFSLFREAMKRLHNSIEGRQILYKYSKDLIDKIGEDYLATKGNETRYITVFNSENGPNIMFNVHGPLCVSSVDVTFALKIDSEFMNKEKYGRLRNNNQCL
ncbi:unnamed protein product [Owenia fusiformis]|uniref:Uncharacterized protein n=1 Tax=Owenia fusiformis TaxID=6347 RepID=A0A8J1UN92_OWEFU|nr:unnamed protein product [Owenia fusiformis]